MKPSSLSTGCFMNNIREIAQLITELDEQTAACIRCGMCQSVCPVFGVTGHESDVARGKIAMLNCLAREMFDDPQGVLDRLDRCTLCGSCAVHCPGSVKILEIFIKARAILSDYIRLPFRKKLLLRGLLAIPGRFDFILDRVQNIQRIFIKPANPVIGTSCARVFSPVLKNRHFIPLAPAPFHRLVPSVDTSPGPSGINAAFFTGCLVDKFFPRIAEAAFNILDYHGIGIFLPEGPACCGMPALTSGDMTAFHRLVRWNLEKLEQSSFDVLITPCATCTFTIKKLWPMLCRDESETIKQRIAKLSSITMDISEFLVTYIDPKMTAPTSDGEPVVVSYHDPCHLKKSLGIFSEPRRLLQTSTGYCLKEMEDADRCCGMGGAFNLNHYEISSRIGARKRDAIAESGCDVVATACPACMLQISDLLSQSGDDIEVKHVMELYSESLK